jgi:hypothetical protein
LTGPRQRSRPASAAGRPSRLGPDRGDQSDVTSKRRCRSRRWVNCSHSGGGSRLRLALGL